MELGKLLAEGELAAAALRRVLDELDAQGRPEAAPLRARLRGWAEELARVSPPADPPSTGGKEEEPPPAAPPGAGLEAVEGLVELEKEVLVPARVLFSPERGEAPTEDEVRRALPPAPLAYVPAWGQFVLRLGDRLLRGNAGYVYGREEQRPAGVRPCRKAACADPECRYYHDPPGRPEAAGCRVRNFFSESFAYVPPGAPPRRRTRHGQRRYGCAGALRDDMDLLSEGQAEEFLAQAAHDLVCAAALLASRPGKKPSPGEG